MNDRIMCVWTFICLLLHFSSAERKATHVMNDVGEFVAVGDEEDAIKTGS